MIERSTRNRNRMNMDMIEKAKTPTAVEDSFARSQVYHLLALGFKHPTPEWFEIYQSGNFIMEILKLLASLPRLRGIALEEASIGEKIYMDLEGVDYPSFEATYLNTFDVGFPAPLCPLNSGLYINGMSRSEVLQEVSTLYKHFGLVMNQNGGGRELQDHLCTELQFLHLLTFKEYKVREEKQNSLLSGYLLAQKDFLERHIIGWFPKFFDKVQQVDQLPFYPDLARIALRFTHCEYEFVRAVTNFD